MDPSQIHNLLSHNGNSNLLLVLFIYCFVFCPVFKIVLGVPVMVQWLANPTRNHEVVGSIPGLAQ